MDRNRKLLLLVAAWVSAGLLSWFVYANAIAPKTEPQAMVMVAARDIPLGTLLKREDLRKVSIPERALPKGSITDFKDAIDRVVLVPLATNEHLVANKLSGKTNTEGIASTIEKGYRAVSVQITDVSGVAGLILPNSRVDVLFTRPGNMDEASTTIILQNVKVLSAGRSSPTTQTAAAAAADARAPRAPVVTLLLQPADAQKLELAKNEGKISLSLRNPMDSEEIAEGGPMTSEALDPSFEARAAAARRKRSPQRDTSNDAAAWARIAALQKKQETPVKKEPEKPRVVVDVFRGDKHVQETFK